MKKSISLIVLILILITCMACKETSKEKPAKDKALEQIKETEDKSVVEKVEDNKSVLEEWRSGVDKETRENL